MRNIAQYMIGGLMLACQYKETQTAGSGKSAKADTVIQAYSVCADFDVAEDTAEIPKTTFETQRDLLLDAYHDFQSAPPEDSVEINAGRTLAKLDQFLDNWIKNISPISCTAYESRDDVDREVYRLFVAYYNPFNLGQYGDRRWEQLKEGPATYVIVQNDIVLDGWSVDGISDVRPYFQFENAKILYLTPMYRSLLLAFLAKDLDVSELQNRYEFLRSRLNIAFGHWGGFHLITHPKVERLELGNDMTTATAHFRIMHEGGNSTLEKVGDTWQIIQSRFTWIE